MSEGKRFLDTSGNPAEVIASFLAIEAGRSMTADTAEYRKVPLLQEKKLYVEKGVFDPSKTAASSLLAETVTEIKPGQDLLDMFTGTGYVGLVAAEKGGKVTACDLNPTAVECANKNAEELNLTNKFHAINSDLFNALGDAQFDIITANPPFTPVQLKPEKFEGDWENIKQIGLSLFDPDFMILKRFLDDAKKHLKQDGRIHLVYTNLAERLGLVTHSFLTSIVNEKGYTIKELSSTKTDESETYTVYELRLAK